MAPDARSMSPEQPTMLSDARVVSVGWVAEEQTIKLAVSLLHSALSLHSADTQSHSKLSPQFPNPLSHF